MHNIDTSHLPNLWQRTCKLILPLLWSIGLMIGMLAAAGAGDSFFLMMRGADVSAVSIPGLLMITVLPFLLTAIAVSFSQPWLLAVLVFLKAFSYGFCAFGISRVFADADWLVRLLLMFTDGCGLPLLMWLWLRHNSISRKRFWSELTVCIAVSVCLGILDHYYVSPFLAVLL